MRMSVTRRILKERLDRSQADHLVDDLGGERL